MKVLAALLTLLALPATAAAHTRLYGGPDDVRAQYQRYIDEAQVRTPWKSVELHISQPGCPQEEASACVDYHQGKWRLFMAAGADDLRTRLMVMHEIGHVYDFTRTTGTLRRWFEDINDYPNKPLDWFHTLNTTWEKFADAYALCAVFPNQIPGGIIDRVFWTYAYDPTVREHRLACDGLVPTRTAEVRLQAARRALYGGWRARIKPPALPTRKASRR